MEKQRIIIVEPEQREVTALKKAFENKEIDKIFDIRFIQPDVNLEGQAYIKSLVKKTLKEISSHEKRIRGVLIDIRILEGQVGDVSGLEISSKIKEVFPEIPVINITNYYSGDDIYISGKATLTFTDGILPKQLFYDDSFSNQEFTSLIDLAHNKILKTKKAFGSNPGIGNPVKKYDVAVITALKKPEFEAFRSFFKSLKKIPEQSLTHLDNSHYYATQLISKEKTLNIVAASDDGMGMTATCSLIGRMITQFNPTYVVLLGICAGIKGKANIGDIIIASHCWDYGSGKYETDSANKKKLFRPSPEPEKLETKLKKAINDFISEPLLAAIQRTNSSAFLSNKKLEAYVQPFASGSAVIANTELVNEIKKQHRKLYGFDMEAYGLFYAASNTSNVTVKALSIKGVSDFGTEDKNNGMKNQHQLYAAKNSVLFFKHFCQEVLLKM